jgi:serine/threonine protein phosphatase PrpC
MCIVLGYSEAGGHPVNEDVFEIQRHSEGRSCWIVSLADGQGGQAGGAEAARLACRIVIESVLSQPVSSALLSRTWLDVLHRADEKVLADGEAGYTTLIGFAVVGGKVVGASSGDSALWVTGADGKVLDLTARQAKNPPVGSGGAVVTPFATNLPASWIVLGMSDGVWKYVGRDGVREAMKESRGRALLNALLTRARLPGSGQLQDDFTAVVIQESV